MKQIVGVKFKNTCKLYYFAPAAGTVYEKGSLVVVETAKGLEVGTVVVPLKEVDDKEIVGELKPVLRVATPRDLAIVEKNEQRRKEAMKTCREYVARHNLEMKMIDCEFAFDGSKVVFYFSSPSRVDFRELVKDLAGALHIRIELRQVGIRDETKMLGGIAPCGRPCCCSCGIVDFKKVTIKMAKCQGLSLNPGKISGLCGRLMCCLEYENEYYSDVYKKMPKIGAEVSTLEGVGNIVSVNMLKMTVKVKIDDKNGGMIYKDFNLDEIKFKKPLNQQQPEPDDEDEEE